MFGSSWPVFLGLTVTLIGSGAFLTGQALASKWRPFWQVLLYCVLLGAGDRFLVFALFEGSLASGAGYLLDTAILMLIATAGYRMTMAHKMVAQYPWLYVRHGLFGWRDIGLM